jgi:hypothetical protein
MSSSVYPSASKSDEPHYSTVSGNGSGATEQSEQQILVETFKTSKYIAQTMALLLAKYDKVIEKNETCLIHLGISLELSYSNNLLQQVTFASS